MPEEMNDYSGPYKPDLSFEDFSKEFLLKLIRVWQYGWLIMSDAWYYAVRKRAGMDMADDCMADVWEDVGIKVNPRLAKVANIDTGNMEGCVKVLQLPLDNTQGPTYKARAKIHDDKHATLTVEHCNFLNWVEKHEPERIKGGCEKSEARSMKTYLVNPKMEVWPSKLPLTKKEGEPYCVWEFEIKD